MESLDAFNQYLLRVHISNVFSGKPPSIMEVEHDLLEKGYSIEHVTQAREMLLKDGVLKKVNLLDAEGTTESLAISPDFRKYFSGFSFRV